MAKDKKGKGSGSKDACYHKVKSRYSVWPSAYASGALVKCRKVGAANWGNKSESFEVQEGGNFMRGKDSQIARSTGAGALTPDAAKQLGKKAEDLQKKKAAKVDVPKFKKEEVESVEEGKSDRPLGVMNQFARGVKQKRGDKRNEVGKYLSMQTTKKQNKKSADADAYREKQKNERGLSMYPEEVEVTEGKYSKSETYVKGTAPVRATYGGKTESFPKETYKKKSKKVEVSEGDKYDNVGKQAARMSLLNNPGPRSTPEQTAEKKARLEKKRGMKLDDHPQFKKDKVEEVYKGKHGQSDKEYADSRSQGGKMVSGDSKMSGAEYTHGRRVKAANPGMQPDVGGKTKPKSQGKMDAGTRADLQYRKANLKKEETGVEEGIDFKGAKRIDDARKAAREKVYKKSPSTKQKDLMKGKFRPGASDEERKSGYRDIMREKGTQPKKDGKPMFSKEELDRIEAIVNSWED